MTTKLVFAGEYDLAVKEQLRQELDRLIDHPVVALDFTDLTYIDSTCVTELLRLRERRCRIGLPPPTILMKADHRVRRIFTILDLLSAFNFVEVLECSEVEVRFAFPSRMEETIAPPVESDFGRPA